MRFDRSKVALEVASRNTVGVFVPLALGALSGHMLVGVTVASGALNVAFSDRPGPYSLRLRRMLLASLVGGLAAGIGVLTSQVDWLILALLALFGLAGGFMVAFGPAAEQISLTSVVLFVVFGGFGLTPESAGQDAAMIMGGGLLQAILAVAGWTTHPHRPERRVLAKVFRALASTAQSGIDVEGAPPVSLEITEAGTMLTEVMVRRGDVLPLRMLLDEAERIRLELLTLQHVLHGTEVEGEGQAVAESVGPMLDLAAMILTNAARAVEDGRPAAKYEELARRAEEVARDTRTSVEALPDGTTRQQITGMLAHMDALAGQLRAALEIVSTETAGRDGTAEAGRRTERGLLGVLGWQGSLETVRRNLNLNSSALRHAVRLAVTLVVAEAVGVGSGLGRSYWIPLTAAIVLKPDFKATFTRGLGRGIGTLLGLGVATVLTYAVSSSVAGRVVLIGVLTFVIRTVGPTNFSLSAVGVTSLVVVLTSFAGAAPEATIVERGVDTVIGGAIALLAYTAWPTWERTRTKDALADVLDAYRQYFAAVATAYIDPATEDLATLDETRFEARVARAGAETSVDRLRSEPQGAEVELDLADALLASSHRFAHSAMVLEAGLYTGERQPLPALRPFACSVDEMLGYLAETLTEGHHPKKDLPDLREAQRCLVQSTERENGNSAFVSRVMRETERVTNSLNTMAELARKRSNST